MTEPLRKEPLEPEEARDAQEIEGGATPPNLRPQTGRPRLVTSGYPSTDRQEASGETVHATSDTARDEARTGNGDAGMSDQDREAAAEDKALFPASMLSDLRSQWDQVQARFVDEPRSAVRDADALVMQATQSLTQAFATERAQLERQWDSGDNVSTEDLRMALQHYRAFFRRLLAV